MSTAQTRVPLWLVALLCVMAFAFQGTRGLWDPDEGRYSSGGIHMEQSGDWLIPTVDGETPHLTKPPMTYWALAASFVLLGHNECEGPECPRPTIRVRALVLAGTDEILFTCTSARCTYTP